MTWPNAISNYARHFHPQKNEDALKRYEAQVYRCYGVLEGQLQKSVGMSILPSRVTAVDFHFLPWVKIHSFAGISLENYPLIKKWLGLMEAREDVQEAYAKIHNTAPK